MKPWLVAVSAALLLIVLVAVFAAGPVAVFVMLERTSDSATAPGTTIALEPAATVTDAEINRLFNDLRSQYLDDRAESITWWLMAATISLAFITVFVTALGIIVVLAGFIGYRWFRDILRDILEDARRYAGEAVKSADEAQTTARDTERLAEQARDALKRITETEQQAHQVRQAIEALIDNPPEDFATSREPRDIEIELGSVETTPVDRATAEAFRLQQQGDTAAAIEKWLAIANILEGVDDEGATRAWFSIGYLYGQANEHQLAITAYNAAIHLNPDNPAVYNNRGNAKGRLGQFEDAIVDYNEAIRLDPDSLEAYINLGAAKAGLGRYEAAIADYNTAMALNPESAEAYNNSGSAKAELGRHEEAIADYDKAIGINPKYAVAYYNRGLTLLELGRTSEARTDLEKSLELADQQGNSDLKTQIEQELDNLNRAD